MDEEKVTLQDNEQPENKPAEDSASAESAEASEAAEEHKPLLEMHETPKDEKKSKKWKKELRDWVVSFGTALLAVLIIRTFLFTIIRVDGPSMSDTLLNNDRLFVTVLDVRLNGPDRFDVVILHYPNRGNEKFVKRVIGVPGDTIVVENGVLSVNGVVYDESYLTDSRTKKFDRSSFTVTLGEDEYFVMGDNRDNSNDSRSVGVIHKSQFVGKVRAIIWPIDRWGIVGGAEEYNQ